MSIDDDKTLNTITRHTHRLDGLHLHGLEVVLELHVDGALRGGEGDRLNVLLPGDLVDLRHVLPHEPVQEHLRQLVAPRVPGGGVHLAEVVELFRLGLLLLGAGRSLVRPEVDAQEGGNALH
eukprot:3375389-Pyramimonas_sp.AAC.2